MGRRKGQGLKLTDLTEDQKNQIHWQRTLVKRPGPGGRGQDPLKIACKLRSESYPLTEDLVREVLGMPTRTHARSGEYIPGRPRGSYTRLAVEPPPEVLAERNAVYERLHSGDVDSGVIFFGDPPPGRRALDKRNATGN